MYGWDLGISVPELHGVQVLVEVRDVYILHLARLVDANKVEAGREGVVAQALHRATLAGTEGAGQHQQQGI